METRVASRAWTSGRLILGLTLIGTACGEANLEGTNQDDSVELSSSASPLGATTAYEAENLTRTSSAIGTKVTSDTAASGGKYVEFNGTAAAGAWIEFSLTNIAAGAYDIKFVYKSNNNRGIVQASLDGTNQGTTCNEYAAAAAYQVACSAGSKTLTAGSHKIRFTVTGKGSGSSGYQMVVDQISFTAQSTCSSAQAQVSPQSYQAPCNSTDWVIFTATPPPGAVVSTIQWHVQYLGSTEFIPDGNDRFHTGQNTLSLRTAPQGSQNVWYTITDSCGVRVTSSHALLTVPDPTCDGCSSGTPPSQPTGVTGSGAAPVCSGTSRTLTVSGGSLGTAAHWAWYTNSSHTASIGAGASITVSPSSTTTYFVRAEGPCGFTADAATTLSVYPPPQFAQNPQSYAVPCSSTSWVSFTAAPSSATRVSSVQWHAQYPGSPDFVPDSHNRYYVGQNTLNLQVAPQDTQYVWCTITDVCGAQVSSNPALMSVPDQSTCQ